MAFTEVKSVRDDIERILGDSIENIGVKHNMAMLITEYINNHDKTFVKAEIARILSRIYDGDSNKLEADIVRLEIFNPDKRNNICKTNENKIGALNAMLPTITEHYENVSDLLERVKR